MQKQLLTFIFCLFTLAPLIAQKDPKGLWVVWDTESNHDDSGLIMYMAFDDTLGAIIVNWHNGLDPEVFDEFNYRMEGNQMYTWGFDESPDEAMADMYIDYIGSDRMNLISSDHKDTLFLFKEMD